MKLVTLICACLFFVSCGKIKKWVTDLDYKTVDHNQQQWVVTNFTLNLGKNKLPETLEILPRDYGVFRSSSKDGINSIGLDLNISSILNLPSGEATLPNGKPVPIYTSGTGMIEIPFGKLNGKAYVTHVDAMTLVGVAITIKQLDDISLGETMAFGSYMLGNVEVTAGVFISEDKAKSGLAIFANLGSLWNKNIEFDKEAYIFNPAYLSKNKMKKLRDTMDTFLRNDQQLEFY